jgi:hypothetical protein
MRSAHILILGIFALFVSCEEGSENPFDDPSLLPPDINTVEDSIPPQSFAYLYHKIFKPTCSNSGCHDGNFEPDFRTMESSYNTLVYQPIIKNDTIQNYPYRVAPGDADNSVLTVRLTRDIDGLSGIMPLVTDPGSDWPANKTEYIQNIRDWINSGAKDVFGNAPKVGNPLPQMLGAIAFASGNSTPLARAGKNPIQIPTGTQSIDLWISLSDDKLSSSQLLHNKIRFSLSPSGFDTIPDQNLSIVPNITAKGFDGEMVDYHHSITLRPLDYGVPGDVIYFKVYVQDDGPDIAGIPNENSFAYVKRYLAFEIK